MKVEGFYMGRTDRLGSRLCPLLNAYRFAKKYDKPFRFRWTSASGVEPASNLFEEGFVERHSVHQIPEHVELPSTLSFSEGLCNPIHQLVLADQSVSQFVRFNHPLGVCAEAEEHPQDNRAQCSQLFLEDILRSDIAKAFRLLKEQLPSRFVGVHLRRGDLLDYLSQPKQFSNIFDRYCPSEVCGLAAEQYKLPVVVFTDSPEVLPSGPQLLHAQELLGGTLVSSFTALQRDLIELLLLGCADVLVGGKSGYTSCASIVGGHRVVHPVELMPVGQYVQALCHSNDAVFEGFSRDQQLASLDRGGQQLLRACQLEVAEGLMVAALRELGSPPLLLARMGYVQMAKQEFAEAALFFSRAVEKGRSPETLIGLVRCLRKQKKREQARSLLAIACCEFPSDPGLIKQAAKFLQ